MQQNKNGSWVRSSVKSNFTIHLEFYQYLAPVKNKCRYAIQSHHRRMLVPPSVNGNIAIQWEWSNFDPSQNPKPLTDYDKTLHNYVHETNTYSCQSAVRQHLGKYVKHKALSFLFWFIFSLDSPTEVTCGQILTHNGSNYAQSRKKVPFWGPHDGRPHTGQIPQKMSKLDVNMHCRASQLHVNEDWRRRRMTSLALFIAAMSTNFWRPLPNVR